MRLFRDWISCKTVLYMILISSKDGDKQISFPKHILLSKDINDLSLKIDKLANGKRIFIESKKNKHEILRKYHDDQIQGGHSGPYQTFQKIASKYYWDGMRKDVNKHIKQCKICEVNPPLKSSYCIPPSAKSSIVFKLIYIHGVECIFIFNTFTFSCEFLLIKEEEDVDDAVIKYLTDANTENTSKISSIIATNRCINTVKFRNYAKSVNILVLKDSTIAKLTTAIIRNLERFVALYKNQENDPDTRKLIQAFADFHNQSFFHEINCCPIEFSKRGSPKVKQTSASSCPQEERGTIVANVVNPVGKEETKVVKKLCQQETNEVHVLKCAQENIHSLGTKNVDYIKDIIHSCNLTKMEILDS
jgi:hypothetical protein